MKGIKWGVVLPTLTTCMLISTFISSYVIRFTAVCLIVLIVHSFYLKVVESYKQSLLNIIKEKRESNCANLVQHLDRNLESRKNLLSSGFIILTLIWALLFSLPNSNVTIMVNLFSTIFYVVCPFVFYLIIKKDLEVNIVLNNLIVGVKECRKEVS